MGNAFCNPIERKALLKFKHDLKDPSNHLSNWFGKDCCKWNGVICNNKTRNNVVQLHLGDFSLSGELNPSLLELKYLNYFNLSSNRFDGTRIPPFLGSLQHLRSIDMSQAGFSGKVPPQLGNLSRLYHLDISSFSKGSRFPRSFLEVDDLEWLSHLSSLQYLDLSNLNLTKVSGHWLHVINMLPSLFEIRLSNCVLNYLTNLVTLDISESHIRGSIETAIGNLNSLGNLCNLEILDLSNNKLQGEISGFLGNSSGCFASKLKSLELQYNLLSGLLPDQLGSLKNLEIVKLKDNSFSGSIPTALGRLPSLRELDLSDNKLNGSLPESFWHLTNLLELRISNNMLEGDVTEAHFANLKKLKMLDISSMVLKLSPDWVPTFRLRKVLLRNCSVGNRFPEWLQMQEDIREVDISNTGISGLIPSWFWNMTSRLHYLNISHNQLEGELSNVLLKTEFGGKFYLNSNRFTGNLSFIDSHIETLDLSRNSFSGSISVLLCNPIEYMNDLVFLDLSENHLSGELPDCWFYWTSLVLISFESNNITGDIPTSLGFLLQLQMLRLRNNSLNGELPSSLRNCTKLKMVDLGENRLTGRVPTWIGESLKELIVMRLHANMFHGEIPQELCYLTDLRIMDMGHNNLSGSIPRCFRNFGTIGSKIYTLICRYTCEIGNITNTMKFIVKGKELVNGDNLLKLVAAIDLSNNKSLLRSLESLDFSNNSLTGLWIFQMERFLKN